MNIEWGKQTRNRDIDADIRNKRKGIYKLIQVNVLDSYGAKALKRVHLLQGNYSVFLHDEHFRRGFIEDFGESKRLQLQQ